MVTPPSLLFPLALALAISAPAKDMLHEYMVENTIHKRIIHTTHAGTHLLYKTEYQD